MADYFNKLCTSVALSSDEAAEFLSGLLEHYAEWAEDMDVPVETKNDLDFIFANPDLRYLDGETSHGVQFEREGSELYIFTESIDSANPDVIVALVMHTLKKFDLPDLVSMEWAMTCSKPKEGGFGGGAVTITKNGASWMTTHDWLHSHNPDWSPEAEQPSEHPDFSKDTWKHDVAADNTQKGYHDWVRECMTKAKLSAENAAPAPKM